MRIFISVLLFLSAFSAYAQVPAIGQWRDHFPYADAVEVTYTPSKVFAATNTAVFYLDLEDHSLNRLTKINVLSDIGISAMIYDAATNQLIVGYANGNLDLIDVSSLDKVNLSDIKRSSLIGDKSVYQITPANGGKAYLSTGFGIVLVDLNRKEIADTYYLGPSGSYIKVKSVCERNDTLFAATENGLYKGYKYNAFLADFNSWTHLNVFPSAVNNAEFSQIVNFNGNLFAAYNSGQFGKDSLYYDNGSGWQRFTPVVSTNILKLKATTAQLLVTNIYNVLSFDAGLNQIQNIFQYSFSADILPQSADFGGSYYWIADKQSGLVRAKTPWDNTHFIPGGPRTAGAYRIKFNKGDLWLSHGVVYGAAWLNSYNHDFVSGRIKEEWFTLNNFTDPNNYNNPDSTFDFLSLAIDPDDSKHVYAGSLSFGGILEIQDNTVVAKYDETNSSLQGWALQPGYCGVTDMFIDNDGNLWALNAFVSKSLSIRKADNSWQSYDLGSYMQNRVFKEMVLGKNSGLLWVAVPTSSQNGGLFVYNNNKTIDDVSDDQKFMYKNGAGLGNLPSADVLCVAEDLDEEIWIGTGAGIAVVYSQNAVFGGGDFDAQQILIEQDGNIQILLETEVVTGIAVDGANRKWISTDGSGVYLMSSDGTQQLNHFTAENSPLLSNQVNDVEIDHSSGEVYFATSQGVISYRGTATIEEAPYSEAYAYPNPVMPGYNGVIAIKGLDRDADVKITDISGNVVFVTKSEGGQAIWNGNNLKGERVATGVYTVMCNSTSGGGKIVAKIMFYH